MARSTLMLGRSFAVPENEGRINIGRNQGRNREPRNEERNREPRNQARNRESRGEYHQKPISKTCPKNSHESPIAKTIILFGGLRSRATAPIADCQSKKKKKQKMRMKNLKFVDGDSTFSTHTSCCRKGRKASYSCMASSFDDFVVSRTPHPPRGRVDIDNQELVEPGIELDL
ncbi:uncharacterized protein LOC107007030 [Solanum pennellii]|uniref:Uncharacterized protein LOC107006945 n=1 Tax=Solanum pennellii TaxID=28526 RepID=A0ABM1V050_SOLPN|nr:uncharacterized protein LOC107006945 [Solanum pennellii]XP_027769118.1 uncharacterized protein LOC107007030 [Solanum pennellii]